MLHKAKLQYIYQHWIWRWQDIATSMYKAKHRLAPSTVSELFSYIICFSIIAETALERGEKIDIFSG